MARTFRAAAGTLAALFVTALASAGQAPGNGTGTPQATLDFDYFKARVQPIFTTKRAGNARCVSCHIESTPMRLQPLAKDAATWSDEAARKNFDVIRSRVVPGRPENSRLLLHPLHPSGGGDPHHDGGKHWTTKDDPEWQTLAAWVRGETLRGETSARSGKVRIIQTNAAGDNVHIIDPATNTVVGQVTGIDVNHGAAASPGGRWLYVSNEAESTLDVVDGRTLRVTSQVKLSGHPNNISASRDGRRVYIAIRKEPGVVDVVDTASLTLAKSIPIKGAGHNTYVTPDGKYVVAGSVVGKSLTIIDVATEEKVWEKEFDLGVRPMAFEQNPDGSTSRIFVQLSDLNGFAVVDFKTRQETARINLPKLAPGKEAVHTGGNASHGMAVTSDNKVLVVCSRLNSAVYMYSLPDLKLLGGVDVGRSPDWVTLTPDGRRAYVANAGSNNVSVVDIPGLREVTKIAVGQVPKRNITTVMP